MATFPTRDREPRCKSLTCVIVLANVPRNAALTPLVLGWITGLRLIDCPASTLRYNLSSILVERPCLRHGLHALLHLRIGFQQNFETFLHAERGHEYFLFDLALDPFLIVGDFRFRESHIVLRQVVPELVQHFIVDRELVGDRRSATQVETREAPNTRFRRI